MPEPLECAAPRRLAAILGFTQAAICLIPCIGWVLKSPAMVVVVDGLVATKFNAALALLLIGIAIVAHAVHRRTIASILAASVLAFVATIASQYFTGVSLGVDTALVVPFISPGEAHPGRISPLGCVAISLLALAVLLELAAERRPLALVWAITAAGVVQLIACTALVSFAIGRMLPAAGGSNVSLIGASSMMLGSWGIIALKFPIDVVHRGRIAWVAMLAPVGITIFSAVFAIWFASVWSVSGPDWTSLQPFWPMVLVLAIAAGLVAAGFISARVYSLRAFQQSQLNQRLTAEIAARGRLEATQRFIMHELDHRVRNTLAQVVSLSRLTAHSAGDIETFVSVFEARVLALSRAHGVLTRPASTDFELSEFIAAILEPFSLASNGRVTVDGQPCRVGARAAIPLCISLFELAANAARHGALAGSSGRVHLHWCYPDAEQRRLRIEWTERGGPLVKRDRSEGQGLSLIRGVISHELDGIVDLEFPPEGLYCSFEFPLPGPEARVSEIYSSSAAVNDFPVVSRSHVQA